MQAVDAPEVEPSQEIRFLSQAELTTLLSRGVPDDEMGVLERPLYLMAAMTGLRQGELLGLRWLDLDAEASKVRVRRAWVRGEFKDVLRLGHGLEQTAAGESSPESFVDAAVAGHRTYVPKTMD